MTADALPERPAARPIRRSAPRTLGPIRPRWRWVETKLLLIVAAALLVGSVSLSGGLTGALALYDPQTLSVYLAALATGHIAFVLAGRRTDQILLPVMGLLGGISLLLMQRLPQDLVTQHWFGNEVGLAQVQLVWLVLGIAITSVTGIVVRSDSWLRRYKYTWAAAGVGLLLLTFVFGSEVNGQRLTLSIGPFSGQPSEFLKVILVVFLAGYLSENRSLLMEQDTRVGPLRLPPVPYLAPMVAMWAIALGIVVIQRDLGANLFDNVRERFDIWLDPFADPLGSGYQVVQGLHAFARGGLFGVGLGNGLPLINGNIPIPEVHTDFPLAALGEELGLVGVLAILGLYLVLVERGLRIGAAAADDFRALLAVGLALVIGIQAFIIAAGNLKVLPLTGVTLPFISYGGSSIIANSLVVGLLLALSDKGVEPPPPPAERSRWDRLRRRGAA